MEFWLRKNISLQDILHNRIIVCSFSCSLYLKGYLWPTGMPCEKSYISAMPFFRKIRRLERCIGEKRFYCLPRYCLSYAFQAFLPRLLRMGLWRKSARNHPVMRIQVPHIPARTDSTYCRIAGRGLAGMRMCRIRPAIYIPIGAMSLWA